MSTYREAKVKAEKLCWQAIDEACRCCFEEGGTEEVLRLLAYLMHGKALQVPVVRRLKRQAAALCRV